MPWSKEIGRADHTLFGGHSLGIAVTGTAPVLDAATTVTSGTKGAGGRGGNMNQSANPGGDGMTASCWDFGKSTACGGD